MTIRDAKSSDKHIVGRFCKDTFSWGDYIEEVWDSWQSKGGLYVIEKDHTIIGVYHVVPYQKETWIEGMRVHPKYRQQGFGKQMLAHAESISPNRLIRLIIESKNQPSIGLVKSMGYELEDRWRLYSTFPERLDSNVNVATKISQTKNMILSSTYADSWKWLPLDGDELYNLIDQKRVLVSCSNDKIEAVGIWNRSCDFPEVFQIGYVNGTNSGITEIVRYAQNWAYELKFKRIQIFIQEKIVPKGKFLDKKALFYLMRKDLPKKKSMQYER